MPVTNAVKKSLKIIFKAVLIPNFNKTINKFIKQSCDLVFDSEGKFIACTKNSGYKARVYEYSIIYGLGFIYKIFDFENKRFTNVQFKALLPDLKLVLLGSYFHEAGHLVFTDMSSTKIQDLPEIELRGKKFNQAPYAHALFNVIEDIAIETGMRLRYRSSLERRGGEDPHSVGSILKSNRSLILKETLAAYKDEPKNFFSLLNFLLLKLSFGSDFIGTNSFYSAHPENRDFAIRFLKESSGTKRIDILLEYWAWLLTTDIEFPEGDYDGNPMPSPGSGAPSGKGGKLPKGSGASASPLEDTSKEGGGGDEDKGSGEKDEDKGEDEDEAVSESEEKVDPTGKISPSGPGSSRAKVNPIDTFDPNDDDIFGDLNDIIFDWSIHQEIKLKDLLLPIDTSKLDLISQRMSSVSSELAYYFLMLKERSKPNYIEHIQSGSALDLGSIRRGERLNIFKELIDRKKDKVTGIMLLCDNSGSMSGEKSEILQHGVLAMCNMMSSLKIDFGVYAFADQETEMNTTVCLKDMDDFFEEPRVLNGFNLLSTDTVDILGRMSLPFFPFSGNRDGYHVEYLSRKLSEKQLDNRILIVFSDGCPWRGEEITAAIERHSNICYIGIGLCDSSVSRYYKQHKVFKTIDDLQELPKYLGSLLMDLIK